MSYQSECQKILDVFEIELRGFVRKQLLEVIGAGWWRTRVPGAVKDSCKQRREQDQSRPFPPLPMGEDIDYTHIGELKDIIIRTDNYREVFAEFFGSNSNGLTTKIEELIATRDAVRHVRPGIGAREHERLIVTCRDVIEAMKLDIENSLNLIIFSTGTNLPSGNSENDVEGSVVDEPAVKPRCLDNLPRPEYSTFFGREVERSLLLEYLDHPRAWVVSIDGIGGVGKTALAVNTAYMIKEQSMSGERDFEYIIWASAKIERLTPKGIAQVLPSFSDLPSLLDVILTMTGFEDESKSERERLELVHEILSIAKCLVVLDNLETVRDTKISDFLADVPPPSKVLITTRERIEESQRNLRLTALSQESARDLLNELGLELDASELLNAKTEELDRLIERVGGIPLAMKLAGGRLATGVSLPSYINRLESGSAQQDILEFCFDDSWTDLDPESKRVLMATTLFVETPSEEEIRRVTDLPELRVKDAIGALTRRAFLNSENDSAHETYRYSLLPLTADFVRRQLSSDTAQETELRDNHSAYLVEKGRYQEALGQTSQSVRSTGSIPDAELLSNMLVEAAFRTYQSGDYQGALSRLQNAETYRETGYLNHTWGVIERDEGAYGRAREKFRKSVSFEKDRLPTWRSWGRMEQRLENWEQAVECFSKASELPRSDPQDFHGLGVCLSRLSGRKGAQERQSLLEQAEQALKRGFYRDPVGYRETHHNVVNSHSLALALDRLGRHTEALIQCRNGLRLEPNNERLIDLNLSLNKR